jgi:hypothetical protein
MVFDPPAYGLTDFRKAHNLSFLQFHRLCELGLVPRTVLIGDKPYITREAAARSDARARVAARRAPDP